MFLWLIGFYILFFIELECVIIIGWWENSGYWIGVME